MVLRRRPFVTLTLFEPLHAIVVVLRLGRRRFFSKAQNPGIHVVNRNLIRNLDDEDIANELAILAPEDETDGWIMEWLGREQQDYAQGEIVDGKIVEVND